MDFNPTLRLFFLFFILLLLGNSSGFAQNGDINLLKAINPDQSTAMVPVFRTVSETTTPLSFGVPIGIIATGLIKKDKILTQKGLEIGAGVVLNTAITQTMKIVIKRERPYVTYSGSVYKYMDVSTHSFPSGHTSSIFALATGMAYTFPKWYVIVPAYSIAGITAYSRMYLGVHYPSDVLSGAAIGIASGVITHYVKVKFF